jgi:polyhydroxyalkanoate synthesis regulator phasin
VQSSGPSGDRSFQEALRAAVERTLAATAGSASETRAPAQELLDDVAKRGQEARDTVGRRGQDKRRVSDLEHRLRDDPEPDLEPQVKGK